MSLGTRLASLARNLFRRPAVEAELREELDGYIDALTEEKIRAGLSPAEARRAALREVGGVEAVREATRESWSGSSLDSWRQDFRYAVRILRRRPGFTAAVVLSLGLGVGGTTAMFSVVNAVLLRPLPYPDAGRLHEIRVFWDDFSSSLSAADRLALHEAGASIGGAGGYFYPDNGFALATPSGPIVVQGAVMTPELPRILGVQPIRGRLFSETGAAEPFEALVSVRFWRQQLGGAEDAVGRGIMLDGDAVTVVGVMPTGFGVGNQPDGDLWIRFEPRQPTRRGAFYLNGIVRLAPGLSAEAAAVRFTGAVVPVLRERYGVNDRWRYGVTPLKDALVGNIRPTLRLLFAAVGMVLLIGVLNVSNLLLARGLTRRQELGVRAALGAGRGRLVRQLLVEAAGLGLSGGALGLLLAALLIAFGGRILPDIVPRMQEVRLDGMVTGFALAAGIGAGLLAGIVPALRLPWSSLAQELREGGRGVSVARRHARARQALVVSEVAVTLTVLTGAVLLVKSLQRVQAADPGYAAANALSFRLALPESSYPDSLPQKFGAFSEELRHRLAALPGVRAVTLAGALPPSDLPLRNNYTVEGNEPDGRGAADVAAWIVADTGYFHAMGIPLLRGRVFSAADRDSAPGVVVVNLAFAARHFGGADPVGKRLKGGDWSPEAPWLVIAGVVGDVPYDGGVWNRADATVYLPYAQNPWWTSPFVVLRTEQDSRSLLPAIRQTVSAIDRALPLRDVATLEQRLRRSAASHRLRGGLLTGLGLVALVLAVTGIYGLLAHEVAQRERETAVRRALGASTGEVVRRVVASAMRLMAMGVALGIAGALALARTLAGFLYGVGPADPVGLGLAAGAMLLAASVACLVPARRAARVDPVEVLRGE